MDELHLFWIHIKPIHAHSYMEWKLGIALSFFARCMVIFFAFVNVYPLLFCFCTFVAVFSSSQTFTHEHPSLVLDFKHSSFFCFPSLCSLGSFPFHFQQLMLFTCVCFVFCIAYQHLTLHSTHDNSIFFVLFNSFIVSKIVPHVYIEQLTFVTIVNILASMGSMLS